MKKNVSVIIPTFNRAAFLPKTIQSVLDQTAQDFEIILVDDGSTDNTAEVLDEFKDRLTYIKQTNQGPASARNTGIKKSQGKFLAFVDSDDWWDKNKLTVQLARMEKNPEYLISHTQEIWYQKGKLLNQKKKHRKYHGNIFKHCLPLCAVSLSTVVARRELFDRVGCFDEDLPCCEDYDLWLRISIQHPFLLIDQPLTLKDGGRTDQLSMIYATGIDKFRIQSLIKMIGKEILSPEQRKLALQELKKKCLIYGNGCLKHGKTDEGTHYLALPEKYQV